jgi:hypothetical protein
MIGDVVKNFVTQCLERIADAVNIMCRACDPKCPVRLEQATAFSEPSHIERMHLFGREIWFGRKFGELKRGLRRVGESNS